MMGRLDNRQQPLFYDFCLEDHVPDDHLLRQIAKVLDLSDVRRQLAPYYSDMGRPSLDPELMMRRFDRVDVAWPSFLVVNLSSSTL